MEIIISGRHYQVTPEFKDYSEKLIDACLSEIKLRISNVRLVLTAEKDYCQADVIIGVKNHDIEATSRAPEMGKAITEAIDKAAKQVMKHLDKMHDRKKRTPVKESEVAKAEAADAVDVAE